MTGWDSAGSHAASQTNAGWTELLTDHPRVLWGLIADVVKAVKAGEGEKRTGRRPAASVGSLDELYEILFPAVYGTQPFPEAFRIALNGRPQDAFAKRIGCNQATISRLLAGRSRPSVQHMELIAHGLGIKPTYFVEYRAMKLGEIVTDVLLGNPALSAQQARELAGACR